LTDEMEFKSILKEIEELRQFLSRRLTLTSQVKLWGNYPPKIEFMWLKDLKSL